MPEEAGETRTSLLGHVDNDAIERDAASSPDVAAEVEGHSTDRGMREVPPVSEPEGDDVPPAPSPRFMQDEGTWLKWVPFPVRRVTSRSAHWTQGPVNAQPHQIKPWLPTVQQAPLWLLDKYLAKTFQRRVLLAGYLGLWLVVYVLVFRKGLAVTEIEGLGTPVEIGCGNTFWSPGNGCGLNGEECRPFNDSSFAFRCPAQCASYRVLNPRAVGAQEIVYQPFVIGGPPAADHDEAFYRGDSFICGAAIHAGIISNARGGCGVVDVIGTQSNFTASERHGISSIGFDSYFPLSISFDGNVECSSHDMRWALLAVTVVFTTFLSLFTASPAAFFFPVFVMVFWTVGTATDPPNIKYVPSLLSNELGRFLPAMFVAWVMYDKMGVRRTLTGLTAQMEKTLLWLGSCWVGALTNYTLDFIPIQRLTPHDLDQQPGAQFALSVIVVVLVVIAVVQVYFFRQEGRLLSHLKLYALLVGAILICLVLPNLKLRIHHYILALLLLPGTSMQTRPSLVYQGILIGLFINGIARWGWDPVLQTAGALRQDAPVNSPLPQILQPVISAGRDLATIAFTWLPSPGLEYDGISILVNDVERFRGYSDGAGAATNFTWTRDAAVSENEYFRFAWMSGINSNDYTRAGTWDANHAWNDMQPGPSKLRIRLGSEPEGL